MAEPTVKTVFGRLKVTRDTTANWNAAVGFIPYAGEVIVYTDYKTKVVDDQTIYIPGIKIGSGNAYVQDLPFVGQKEAEDLLAHIQNSDIHITSSERNFWNSKINISEEVINERLVFNRD